MVRLGPARRVTFAFIALGLFAAKPAAAQYQGYAQGGSQGQATAVPPPVGSDAAPETNGRNGFFFGAGLGLGAYESRPVLQNVPYGELGLRYQAEIGYFFIPRFALLLQVGKQSDSETVGSQQISMSEATFGLAARYWLLPDVWLEGGLGDASIPITSQGSPSSASGWSFDAAVGVELYSGSSVTWTAAFQAELDPLPLASVTGENSTTKMVPVSIVFMADFY